MQVRLRAIQQLFLLARGAARAVARLRCATGLLRNAVNRIGVLLDHFLAVLHGALEARIGSCCGFHLELAQSLMVVLLHRTDVHLIKLCAAQFAEFVILGLVLCIQL